MQGMLEGLFSFLLKKYLFLSVNNDDFLGSIDKVRL